MRVYYNEFDPEAASILRRLIEAGCLPFGDVDTRSIVDVKPDDLRGYQQCHFFAGSGGWALALRMAGWPGSREVWTGSCPCQPFSCAGKGKGFGDERHLWPHWARLIRERQPAAVFGEQVAAAPEWVRLVRGGLEAMDYAVGYTTIEAACAGAPHRRDRGWFAAYSKRNQQPWEESCGWQTGRMGRQQQSVAWNESWQSALSRFRVLGDGLPRNVGATDAARNAIVPQVAEAFITSTMGYVP